MKSLAKYFLLLLSGLLSACTGSGSQKIGIYVAPFYNSDPLSIAVGPYSERLATDSPRKLLALADEIKENIDQTNAVVLYVLAIRLYDLGQKDQAAYWYYNAQFRRRIFLRMEQGADPTGMPATLEAFNDLSGRWINGYAWGDPDKLASMIEGLLDDCATMGYIGQAYPGYDFRPADEQQEVVDTLIAEWREEGVKYLREHKEDILRQRRENGVEGKY